MLNYFALLGLPTTFALSAPDLDRAYFAQQQRAHPDAQATPSLAATQAGADLNQAYTTLKKPLSRALHLLQLQGIDLMAQHKTYTTPALLQATLDAHEALDAAHTLAELNTLATSNQARLDDCLRALQQAAAQADWPSFATHTLALKFLQTFAEHLAQQQTTKALGA